MDTDKIKMLGANDRLLLGLFYYEKLSIEEIAVILNKPAIQIKEDIDTIHRKVQCTEKKSCRTN